MIKYYSSNFKNKNINDSSLWEEIHEEGKLACCYMSLAINGGNYPCICLKAAGGREGKEEEKGGGWLSGWKETQRILTFSLVNDSTV